MINPILETSLTEIAIRSVIGIEFSALMNLFPLVTHTMSFIQSKLNLKFPLSNHTICLPHIGLRDRNSHHILIDKIE